ncbi:riboflavin synthase subunit alpha [Neptunomonas qingdaonensis]|uniref:Riboflavin synthase n=1 Tax=Neptunomonas qingdaonensis TaxID=1045558 RepID=A0A1I2PRK6_9GAMM|nr:riboflavin synthase subunit alpha [Neptunomonas qingdaonensis]SFG18694.1 riboflavin synthase alpha chain [Neptunomonas qingdaonensis]
MFTGIVQGLAEVIALNKRDQFMQIRVSLPEGHTKNLQTGASIAINGTCLTITEFSQNEVQFDVIEETLQVTNLGKLEIGDRINFERAARYGDEIGGHQLSGHISSTATISQIIRTPDNCTLWLTAPAELIQYIIPKGFVALNGCSLTTGEVQASSFSIHLIPETLAVTTFGNANIGDKINLEVDPQTQAIVDTVNRFLHNRNL